MRGLILFAHGARDPRWALPFEACAAEVRARDARRWVRNAYLEFMSPTLPEAGREAAAAGCTEVDVLPLFLGAGGHVRKDLPALVEALRAECPGVRFRLQPAIGESPQLVHAMAEIALALPDPTT